MSVLGRKILMSACLITTCVVAVSAANVANAQRLDDEGRKQLQEYRFQPRQQAALEKYIQQLEAFRATQQEQGKALDRQLESIGVTGQNVLPLLSEMINALQDFIKLDLPFQQAERREAVIKLRSMLNRSEVSIAEKYRAVVSAYSDEQAYGRNIGNYRQVIEIDGEERTADILRIGRLALYYQTLDGKQVGKWDRALEGWDELPGRYRLAIKQGLRTARKQIAPVLLELPMPAPDYVKREEVK